MTDPAPDPRQQVLDAEGHVLVLGGAGSGKTTIALRKAIRRIDEQLLPGQSVLFLSFSRAAVARIGQASKTEAPKEKQSQLAVQTFHSFCWELLRSHGYLLGAPKRLQILPPHDERALSGRVKPGSAEWAEWEEERDRLFRGEGKVVFDLFAPGVAELLARASLLRDLVARRFPLVIVDEAQDTGPDAWRCIEILAPFTQIICLADLEQQIFDHLPGVGPERIARIEEALKPLRVDLGAQNNRSAGTEIAAFANDILSGEVRGGPYTGVSKRIYDPKATPLVKLMRIAIGMIWQKIEKETGQPPDSCALLAPTGSSVARISAALSSGERPIPHKVLFDEAEALLASRLAAFLLEPKAVASHDADVAQCLELLAAVQRARGSKSALGQAANLLKWAEQAQQGKKTKTIMVTTVDDLVAAARGLQLTGDPRKDWLLVKALLRASTHAGITAIAGHLDYLVAFNRGRRIAANLSAMWTSFGCYAKAREALDDALVEDQILSGAEDLTGIHVMTIHRSKAKQFDGVIIFREGRPVGPKAWESSFVWRGDTHPHHRSRRILRVAVTRARRHVLILDPAYPVCPIISPFKL